MKRKKIEIKNISNKIEINNISNNFFLNKINRENSMKRENSFSSFEEVELESILANPVGFTEALINHSATPHITLNSKSSYESNMEDIQKILGREGYRISMHEKLSSVYEVTRPDRTQRIFRFGGKVWELFNLICEVGIEEVISKYSYKL